MLNNREIREKAEEALGRSRSDKPPVDVVAVAEAYGIAVIEQPNGGDISGCLITREKRPFIVVNADHHLNRKRFTISHEIGHFVLAHKQERYVDKAGVFRMSLRDDFSSQGVSSDEIEANRFAAELIMPREFLLDDLDAFGGFDLAGGTGAEEQISTLISNLANRYKVSQQALTYRLVNLGILHGG